MNHLTVLSAVSPEYAPAGRHLISISVVDPEAAFATLFMTGLIWFVLVVHYPLFGWVGRADFAAYEPLHTRRTGSVVCVNDARGHPAERLPASGLTAAACAVVFADHASGSRMMSRRRLSPIFTKLAAACSGLSHRVGQGWVRPVLQALQPQAILRIEGLRADQRLVALTIDDSPTFETARILDMLRDRQATATFFVHGSGIRSAAEKRLVRRIQDDGHEVGNHMPESVPSIQLRPFEFAAGFERNHRILRDAGVVPVRFRASHGFHNRPMAEFMRTRGVELGYRPEFYLGLNFPWDAFFEIPGWYARHNARVAVPGRMVVFHDNQDRRDRRGTIINQSRLTLAALPVFFAELEKQGFEAKSLAQVEAAARSRSAPTQ